MQYTSSSLNREFLLSVQPYLTNGPSKSGVFDEQTDSMMPEFKSTSLVLK